MRIAILQPYFFPYIGYFQLISAVDRFVFFDDVQYIERGWMNRNLIRAGSSSRWLTMPVKKASRDTAIKDRTYLPSGGDADSAVLRLISASYARSPHFDEFFPMIKELITFGDRRVSALNSNLLFRIARHLGCTAEFVMSSSYEPSGLKGKLRIINLCRRMGATHYINPIGGVGLYDRKSFELEGISLSFLRTKTPGAQLAEGPKQLSIIDWLMLRGERRTGEYMSDYDLVDGS